MKRLVFGGLVAVLTLAGGVLIASADIVGDAARTAQTVLAIVPGECHDPGTDPYVKCNASLTRIDDPARIGVAYSATGTAQLCFRPADCTGPTVAAGKTGTEVDDTNELVGVEFVPDNRVVEVCEGPNCVAVDVPGRRVRVFDTGSNEADVWVNGNQTPVSVRELCTTTNPDYPCAPGQPGGDFVGLPLPE